MNADIGFGKAERICKALEFIQLIENRFFSQAQASASNKEQWNVGFYKEVIQLLMAS